MRDSLVAIADEVKHLTDSDIEELYQRYLNGEKNSALIADYEIDINPNKLIKVLPPQQLLDTVCPYCQIPMYVKRKSKSHSSWKNNPIECYKCAHKIFASSNSCYQEYCECSKCLDLKRQKAIDDVNKKREIIAESHCLQKFSPIDYECLTFTEKLILLTLFRIQTDEDFGHILSLDNPLRIRLFTPSSSMDEGYIDRLYRSNILLIDPLSSIDAFPDENPAKSYYQRKVQWIVNVSLDGENRNQLSEIYNKIYFDIKNDITPEWENELFELLLKISVEEVLQYLYIKIEELNVIFVAEKKTREITEQLLIDFSVSEIYYFVKKAVEDAHIFYTKGFASSRKHAGNIIPGKMLSLGERALKENWETYKYNRDSRAPRSYLSQMVFDFLLNGEDAGFNKAIGKYWEQEISPKYFPTNESNKENNLYCIKCNSKNVQINMIDSKLSLDCKDCGFKKGYTSEN
ncbi:MULTISPECIES: hypothetical protein [unclassified Psychrobacter]|uniref:hypothetical protein n=1 Tax=unclassified Psychrobacter TaxID=196806 RepID=UPI000713C60D|nr:hypothetical protein [Psychrobacter sp. P11F6]KRG32458.1 hypothetical protein AK822_13030 [Psychrobacter sp. P11F6]